MTQCDGCKDPCDSCKEGKREVDKALQNFEITVENKFDNLLAELRAFLYARTQERNQHISHGQKYLEQYTQV
jgi:hypothetical protein